MGLWDSVMGISKAARGWLRKGGRADWVVCSGKGRRGRLSFLFGASECYAKNCNNEELYRSTSPNLTTL